MDESSRLDMETDVSSTTGDVPEIQEVSGSHGNVETVIVVEEVMEEDMIIENAKETQLSEEKQPKVTEVDTSSQKSPQKDVEAQNSLDTCSQVADLKQNSPLKDFQKETSPVVQNTVQKSPIKPIEVTVESEVIVDSSSPSLIPCDEPEKTLLADSFDTSEPVCPPPEKPLIDEPKSPIKEQTESSDVAVSEDKKEEMIYNVSVDICEKSNDSHIESTSDLSEKDNNKSISRELKSLIKSAKESKIISECTQLKSKTRKSRVALDSSNTSLNTSSDPDKIQTRRSSSQSQISNSSEPVEKAPIKRSMRSQNPEFVNKVKLFLNSVTGKNSKVDSDDENDESKRDKRETMTPSPKKKKQDDPVSKLRSDPYCWRCHWAVEQIAVDKGHPPLQCKVCPRSFHFKCLSATEKTKITSDTTCICPECLAVLHAESSETRSPAMKKISLGQLCDLLRYALQRMMDLNGVEPFMQPVDKTAFPDYDKYVVHPMDLTLMKNNIDEGLYGSTEAFLADAQWILHNSVIFNTLQSKLTGGARALVRSCRAELGEIEACPECYAAAHARRPTWFTDVCTTPHMLLWAKLKGFPYWPAKGMTINNHGMVDVRFFGAHDRAWVPAKDCFLYSEKDPNNFRTKRQDILDSMQEAEQHIRNISRKYGKFVYPPFKTQFDPTKLTEQLKMMIPNFEGELHAPVTTSSKEKIAASSPNVVKPKRRSNSKSSKNSAIDGEMSDGEDTEITPIRKMSGGAEIAREEDTEISSENKKIKETEEQKDKVPRKRRRSELEEAVITIIDSSADKKKRIENENKNNDKNVLQQDNKNKLHNKSKNKEADKTKDKEENSIISKTVQVDTPNGPANNSVTEKTPLKASKIKIPKTSTPKEKEDKAATLKQKEDKATAPKQKEDKMATPKQKEDKIAIPKQKEDKVATPKQKEDKVATPKQKEDKVATPKQKEDKTATPKQKEDKIVTQKSKPNRIENTVPVNKEKSDDKKSHKRRSSKVKSLNNSQLVKDKNLEKKEVNNIKTKENDLDRSLDNSKSSTIDTPKSAKDRIQFDDDTSLALIARETAKNDMTRLPTISSVRSLSTSHNANINTTSSNKSIEITVEVDSDSSIFIPTSTETVRNMKEAVNKLQKLRTDSEQTSSSVGRVGVRAFARMASAEKTPPKENVEVEIKAEPMDLDDIDRHNEKMDLMNVFHLRPVNPPPTSLRDVRINKVVVAPLARKTPPTKPAEVRVKARKTFPQPKKPEEPRSDLNGKNSMVYIPIQPPTTQAPVRQNRPVTLNTSAMLRPIPTTMTTSVSGSSTINQMNTPSSLTSLSNSPSTTSVLTNSMPCVPTVGQIPTTVHTVPVITSVNGQCFFSLQPVMSVGGVDNATPTPIVNGLPERSSNTIVPVAVSSANTSGPHISCIQPMTNGANGTTTITELPQLHQRPVIQNPLDSHVPHSYVPSVAGPLTAKLNQNAAKLTDYFRNLLEDTLDKIDEPAATITSLKLQLEQTRWLSQQEIKELKHNSALTLVEMRAAMEKDKQRALSEARRLAQIELEAAVKVAKSKQWCANCSQEAHFYCCWNTSYCDYPCQRAHWSQHFAVCTQQRIPDKNSNDTSQLDKRLQPAPDNLPKNLPAPTLTVGGKITPTRVTQAQNTSIILSMVKDGSGSAAVKCVGTFKPPAPPQLTPVVINNQIINTDENTAKKVVTSGGYLLVGSASNVPVTARRPHTIQYYT